MDYIRLAGVILMAVLVFLPLTIILGDQFKNIRIGRAVFFFIIEIPIYILVYYSVLSIDQVERFGFLVEILFLLLDTLLFFLYILILYGRDNYIENCRKYFLFIYIINFGLTCGILLRNLFPLLQRDRIMFTNMVMIMTVYYILKRVGVLEHFKFLLNHRKFVNFSIPIHIVFVFFIAYLGYFTKIDIVYALLIQFLINFILFIILIQVSFNEYLIYGNRLKKTLLLQQESYIKSLESIQEDIRKYNHDYKNLLTGALLQAEDGDYEGVRLYLKDILDEFEEKLGKQISKNTQLKKIKSNEIKGILLSKMSKMEELKIEFHLEVLNEVDRINMKTTDLVRCLGILLDNAIEEVDKQEERIIKLVILQEEKVTTIMVKNPVTEKVNIQNIYQEGFSTKGERRGLGLSNYREIVENYENIVRETISTEKEFNQVLKIG